MALLDFQNEKGDWIKRYWAEGKSNNTISYCIYRDMLKRCVLGGEYQQKRKTYAGCSNEFKDYGHFVEWCRTQIGYGKKGYELDKDILVKGNKVYGPDTCVFIPYELNLLLIKTTKRGEHPPGVYFNKEKGLYQAQITIRGKATYLGRFSTSDEAYQAYKKAKENYVKSMAREYKDLVDIRVYDALMSYQVEITD